MENIKRAKKAREEYFEANKKMIKFSEIYREAINSSWEIAKEKGISKRKLALQLGITEGSLRDLLRTKGTTRKQKRKH